MKCSDLSVPRSMLSRPVAIHIACAVAGSLPESGKAAVLEHLLSAMKVKTLEVLRPETRKEILGELLALDATRRSFIDKYSVTVSESSPQRVQLTLPVGTSFVDFLSEADSVARHLYDWRTISSATLAFYRKQPNATRASSEPISISVERNAPDVTEQVQKYPQCIGWCDVDTSVMIAAHSAFLIATRKDLLDGLAVSCRDGSLWYSPDRGLQDPGIWVRQSPGERACFVDEIRGWPALKSEES